MWIFEYLTYWEENKNLKDIVAVFWRLFNIVGAFERWQLNTLHPERWYIVFFFFEEDEINIFFFKDEINIIVFEDECILCDWMQSKSKSSYIYFFLMKISWLLVLYCSANNEWYIGK